MERKELLEIIKSHNEWLNTRCSSNVKGKRANLHNAYLCGADLRNANLCGAYLCGAKNVPFYSIFLS